MPVLLFLFATIIVSIHYPKMVIVETKGSLLALMWRTRGPYSDRSFSLSISFYRELISSDPAALLLPKSRIWTRIRP